MREIRQTHRPWRRLRWPLEAFLVRALLRLAGTLPLDRASATGAFIGRHVLYRTPLSRRARQNLARVYPRKSAREREGLLRAMWENLGRYGFEYPHLRQIVQERVSIEGQEGGAPPDLLDAPMLLLSAHLANFEAILAAVRARYARVTGIVRPVNNEWLRKDIAAIRDAACGHSGSTIAKSARTALMMRQILKHGGKIGMLVDQKVRRGARLDFLGRPTETSLVPASLALRHGADVYIGKMSRLDGAWFRLRMHGPLRAKPGLPFEEATRELAQRINDVLTAHIHAHPADWLWLHRRWG